jgi:hypothetical protein
MQNDLTFGLFLLHWQPIRGVVCQNDNQRPPVSRIQLCRLALPEGISQGLVAAWTCGPAADRSAVGRRPVMLPATALYAPNPSGCIDREFPLAVGAGSTPPRSYSLFMAYGRANALQCVAWPVNRLRRKNNRAPQRLSVTGRGLNYFGFMIDD